MLVLGTPLHNPLARDSGRWSTSLDTRVVRAKVAVVLDNRHKILDHIYSCKGPSCELQWESDSKFTSTGFTVVGVPEL